MRRKSPLIACVFLVLSAVFHFPARARPVEELNCPLGSLTGAQRDAFKAFVAERGARDDPRNLVVEESLLRCATRFGWSRDHGLLARAFLASSAGEAQVRDRLVGRGLNLAEIDATIAADGALLESMARLHVVQGAREFMARHSSLLDALVVGVAAPEQLAAMGELYDFIRFRGMREFSGRAFVGMN